MRAGLAAVRAGATENDFVAAMMGSAIAAGSEYVGMERSSPPAGGQATHGTWRRGRLAMDEPVFLEMAGCHDRYHAALMRCAWLGAMRNWRSIWRKHVRRGLRPRSRRSAQAQHARHRMSLASK